MALLRTAALTAMLGLPGSPARSESSCGALEKYLTNRQEAFLASRGERIGNEMRWKARTSLPGGDCEIAAAADSREFSFDCSFNVGGDDAVRLASYQSLGSYVQNCLNSLGSRDDWRKRDTPTTDGGRAIAETTWTWTMIRTGSEHQIVLSNHPERKAERGKNLLVVIWRRL